MLWWQGKYQKAAFRVLSQGIVTCTEEVSEQTIEECESERFLGGDTARHCKVQRESFTRGNARC